MDKDLINLQVNLQEKYLKSVESLKGQSSYHLYETMIKLNAEMIAQALQEYDKLRNQ